jgi:DNA polymerase I-like protein with 3'-5' exonuclease and polymerase domains
MKFIGFDIETRGEGDTFGLQPYRVLQGKAEVTSAAFVTDTGDVLFAKLFPTADELRGAFQDYIERYSFSHILIGWNTPFDASWMAAYGMEDIMRECQWIDGEVMRRCLENDTSDKRYGLKPTVAKYLPEFTGYEQSVGGNFDQVDDVLLSYNILDAGLTAKLGRLFLSLLSPRQQVLTGMISRSILPVASAWLNGIEISPEAVDAYEKKADTDLVDAMNKLTELAGPDFTAKTLTSPIKLKQFLQTRGVPVTKTDRSELSKYAHMPLVKAISDAKKATTAKTKFIGSLRKTMDYNGGPHTHPSCRLWNTYTGRFGYTSTTGKKKYQTGIAIHQWPRDPMARNCIVAPAGMLLVECDFAGQESRLMCDQSGDEVMFDIFTNGKDLHTYMASIIAEWDYDTMLGRVKEGEKEAKNFRQLAKVANLSCQYRTGWKTLIDVARKDYGVIFDEKTSQKLVGLYRSTYKRVPEYWDNAIRFAKENGYAETRGGRRVFIDRWDRAVAWSSESTALNFPIQGTGADMKFLGIATVDPILWEVGGRYMLDLHDALFMLVPDTSAGMDAALRIKHVLSNLPYKEYYGWTPKVALPVDLKVGKAWGSLKEVN